MASYPTSIKSFVTRSAGDIIQPAHVNDLQDEVNAIEVGLLTGPLTIAGQIKFPATQAPSADANTLDDYEEGTWSPALASSGGGSGTYLTQLGYYVKIGQFVWVSARISLTSKAGFTAGSVSLTGLPFTIYATAAEIGGFLVPYFNGLTTSIASLALYTKASTTTAQLVYVVAGGAVGVAELTVGDLGNTTDLMISGTYRATA